MKIRALMVALAVAPVSLAVTTSHWTQTSESDFKKGTFHNVVATNLGDMKLSRAVKTILEQDAKVSVVTALVEAPDHTIYAGTGPQGTLLKIKDDKVSTVLKLEDAVTIQSLLIDRDGKLLIGTTGDQGRVLRYENGKTTEIFKADGVQYIWALAQTADGNIYAATGPNGQLFEIKPDGTSNVVVKTNEANLLSMISDGRDLLYVGTDPNGLVYRVNRKTKEAYVLYDANESQISALTLDGEGNLYAATADALENAAGGDNANGEKVGRPESGQDGMPLPEVKPKTPAAPKAPSESPDRIGNSARNVKPTNLRSWLHEEPSSARVYFLLDDPGSGDEPGQGAPGAPDNAPPEPAHKATTQPSRPDVANADNSQGKSEGNAIYKIDRNGFVTEVFRNNLEIHSMIERNGVLIVGTGPDGLIYQIDPNADENIVVARVDPKQVTALLADSDGRIFMGLANTGGIAAMSGGFASNGNFVSPVLDANQVSRFGNMHIDGSLPKGTAMTVATRSGNVADPSDPGWSAWTKDVPAQEFMQVASSPARYLQYRLTMTTNTAKASPIVEDVDVAYQTPNLPPIVKSVKITDNNSGGGNNPPAANAPNAAASGDQKDKQATANDHHRTITWDASDPNNDTLVYSLYFRNDPRGPWILLKDKIKDTTFDWDTRSVADGRYEIKVVASDAPSNPRGTGKTASRVSDPAIIDNTPPVIGDIATAVNGQQVKVNLRIVDRTSTVASAKYTIDSQDDWQSVLPLDNIFDSNSEDVSFTTQGLKPGDHQITISATDSHGNEAFETVLVNVPAPTASK